MNRTAAVPARPFQRIPFVLTPAGADAAGLTPKCPVCQGPTWDRSRTKREPSGADFACRDRMCPGALS